VLELTGDECDQNQVMHTKYISKLRFLPISHKTALNRNIGYTAWIVLMQHQRRCMKRLNTIHTLQPFSHLLACLLTTSRQVRPHRPVTDDLQQTANLGQLSLIPSSKPKIGSSLYGLRNEGLVWPIRVVVCLLHHGSNRSLARNNGWPHSTLRYHQPISCQHRC